jgi:hypothetical protein
LSAARISAAPDGTAAAPFYGRRGGGTVIAILGTILLLPIALVTLAYGFVRFAVKLVAALGDAAISHLLHTG